MTEEKEITVIVPSKEIVRFRRLKPKSKIRWAVDFRGVRNGLKTMNTLTARKHRGERAAFNTPDNLQRSIDEYFASCEGPMINKYGVVMKDSDDKIVMCQTKPYTISGLALYVGLSTEGLNRYCSGRFDYDDEEVFGVSYNITYSRMLKTARQRIESYIESRLYDRDGTNGARFSLDSVFGWCTQKERAEIEDKRFNRWLRKQELALKKQLMSVDSDEFSGFEIKIVKKEEK